MNKKDLKRFFNEITPKDEQKQKMLSEILNYQKRNLPMKRAAKRFSMLAAVVAICVLTTTIALAATFNWHEMLIKYLNPSEKQMQDMGGAVNTPNATVTKNGVIITVKQTIADSLNIYVLYEMTVPEGIELNDDIEFEWEYLALKTDAKETGVTSEQSRIILDQNENKRTALIHLSKTAPISNGSAELQLENLSQHTYIYDDEGKYIDVEVVPLVEGEWNLKWDFSYEDKNSKIIEANEFVSINGSQNKVTKIIVSPMSVYIRVEGDDILTSVRPIVNFKDGSQIIYDVYSKNKSFSYSSPYNDLYYGFENIIAPDDIKSITIGEVTIPILFSE